MNQTGARFWADLCASLSDLSNYRIYHPNLKKVLRFPRKKKKIPPEKWKIHASTENLNGIVIARKSAYFPDEKTAPSPRLATKPPLTFCAFGREGRPSHWATI
jgi:hypothetical protein